MMGPGTWELSSTTDPRWNFKGSSSCMSGIHMCQEAEAKIKALVEELGDQPEDLTIQQMKD